MSHITRVKTQLKDGLVLRKTLKKLGYEIGDGSLKSAPWGIRQANHLEMVARKEGVLLGFRRTGSGDQPYEIIADWAAPGIGREKVIDRISQLYSQEKILDLARVKGYAVVKNSLNQKGQVEIVLRKLG